VLAVHLLGRPWIDRGPAEAYQFRSRKSWALVAYLLLAERPPTLSQLASLLFADADDPLRALRWSLAEIRRALETDGSVDGDPVTLTLADTAVVDVSVVTGKAWMDAVEQLSPQAGQLDGIAIRGAATFETWLLGQRRRLAGATEAVLHEAALGWLSRGDVATAIDYAVRLAGLSPLDENHQALLIRLYRQAGDDPRARAQYATCVQLCQAAFGSAPGSAVEAALREPPARAEAAADEVSIEAVIEAGTAAISAGAVTAGIQSVRAAVHLADQAQHVRLRTAARLVLAEALIHSVGGLDEEGQAILHEVDRIATTAGDLTTAARARAELGYVDFLRARYDRAELWLADALRTGADSPSIVAKSQTYLGGVASDRADYPAARRLLDLAVGQTRTIDDPRGEAYGLSLLGRISLLRGELGRARDELTASIELAQRHHWLAFLPWPQALLGEVHRLGGDIAAATEETRQAFARACQIGDPCWEGMAQRGLGLLAEQAGEPARAFELLTDARARMNRLADPYVWLEVYILDALTTLGRRYEHPSTMDWIATMNELACRTGMRELTVRSLLHGAAGGDAGAGETVALLAPAIDNPALDALIPMPDRHPGVRIT
jgi:DNA-binding SARP family transcriptional activator